MLYCLHYIPLAKFQMSQTVYMCEESLCFAMPEKLFLSSIFLAAEESPLDGAAATFFHFVQRKIGD